MNSKHPRPNAQRPTPNSLDVGCRMLGVGCFRLMLVAVSLFTVIGCRNIAPPAPTLTPTFTPATLEQMDRTVTEAITANKLPGAVVWLERNNIAYHKAFGRRALVPTEEPMTEDTIFDAASLTKVVATAPAVMLLIERGQVELDAPVQKYIAEFRGDKKELVTVRHLLTHTSGLRPGISLNPAWSGYRRAIELACAEKLVNPPGTVFRYSDINFILLGELVRRASGQSLNEFVATQIYRPLKMNDTDFLPLANRRDRYVFSGERPSSGAETGKSHSAFERLSGPDHADIAAAEDGRAPQNRYRDRIAPTEQTREEGLLRGQVHDPTARRMGGVAGHAGLFTTAADLARYAKMMLQEGQLDGKRIFRPETIKQMTSVQSPEGVPARRGLGWDIDSAYSGPRGNHFPLGSFGHTGFTGTSLWIDPFSKTFLILLSSRVHPDGKGNVLGLRLTLGTLAAESVIGFNFAGVAGGLTPRIEPPKAVTPAPSETKQVLNGIDVLVKQNFAPLNGLRIGLITNHSGTDRQRNPTIDLLHRAPDVKLAALFSPEHGIRGVLDERVGDSTDDRTGLPVYSLYGERRVPTSEQLSGLDALVFDIQDIGCRFYTYISTMGNCLEAAGKTKLKFVVLDRVNPINGTAIDGPVLNAETSFTAYHPIPVRHGMTVGELARMFNAECGFNADLSVIPLENWARELWFDQTQLPWINPSPNMRSVAEATLYPGVGLLETTALSVGRGTGTPFEVIGAPYVDDIQLASELNCLQLKGVRFVPVRFTPDASVYKGKPCAGVNVIITDREACRVVDIGIAVAQTMHRLYPKDFDLEKFDRLLGNRATVEAIKSGKTLADIRQAWTNDLEEFSRRRAKFLLY